MSQSQVDTLTSAFFGLQDLKARLPASPFWRGTLGRWRRMLVTVTATLGTTPLLSVTVTNQGCGPDVG